MKTLIIVIIIALVGYGIWNAVQTKPDASVPEAIVSDSIDTQVSGVAVSDRSMEVMSEQVAISFKGFGPGKEHTGTFNKLTSTLAYNEGKFAGSIVIDMNAMTTDNEKLTGHLKTADFFDTAKYPTATFTPTAWTMASTTPNSYTMNGNLTLHGVTKAISFPVTYQEVVPAPNVRLAYTKSYVSTFVLNLKDFGISQTFANEQIEVSIVVPVR